LDLLLARCSQPGAGVFWTDSSGLIQLIKTTVDFLSNLGKTFLLYQFLFF